MGKVADISERRGIEGLTTLVPEIRRLANPVLGSRGFVSMDLFEHWTDIIGADLAKGVRPEKLTFEKEKRTGGTLTVLTAGGAFAMLFEHQKSRVLERINSYFGYPAVSKIKMIQGALKLQKPILTKPRKQLSPEQLQELSDKVEIIADKTLRQSAFDLGKAILEKDINKD